MTGALIPIALFGILGARPATAQSRAGDALAADFGWLLELIEHGIWLLLGMLAIVMIAIFRKTAGDQTPYHAAEAREREDDDAEGANR